MLWKCCTQYTSKFGKLSSGNRTAKGSFHFISKKYDGKQCSNYHTIALISHASRVMLKILQAKLWRYVNHELPDVQPGFRKGRETRDQIDIFWIIKKAREFLKSIYFCFTDYTKGFDYIDHTQKKPGKFFKRWECQTTLPASLKIWMQVKKQQWELDMEKQTHSK